MAIEIFLVAHIVVLGYWLGADLVINSTYRYACWARTMPFDERNRLMDHVMHVDQHVRYALVLQFCLGLSLAALNGYVPFGWVTVGVAAFIAIAWIVLVELVYQRRYTASGALLDTIDLTVWIGAGILLLLASMATALGLFALPLWLTIKLALFGGVFFSGIGIRIALKTFFLAWQDVGEHGSSDARETAIRRSYVQATLVLLLLWAFIAAIVVMSIWQPA